MGSEIFFKKNQIITSAAMPLIVGILLHPNYLISIILYQIFFFVKQIISKFIILCLSSRNLVHLICDRKNNFCSNIITTLQENIFFYHGCVKK